MRAQPSARSRHLETFAADTVIRQPRRRRGEGERLAGAGALQTVKGSWRGGRGRQLGLAEAATRSAILAQAEGPQDQGVRQPASLHEPPCSPSWFPSLPPALPSPGAGQGRRPLVLFSPPSFGPWEGLWELRSPEAALPQAHSRPRLQLGGLPRPPSLPPTPPQPLSVL